MKKSYRKMIFGIALLSASFTVCASSCSETVDFPIDSVPEEFSQTFDTSIEALSSEVYSYTPSSEVKTNPNDILLRNSFKVYYDNTTGCFMEYVNLRKKDSQDMAYQMFARTMTSLKDIFDCANSYDTYTIADGEKYLQWKKYGKNIFTNFSSEDAYTSKTTKPFANDSSPINMWVDLVKSQLESDDKSISVYISDLNEQNGLLAKSGKDIKDMLDSYPDTDFLLISYNLSFKGKISSPTFDNEGDKDDYVETENFQDYVDRKYYILAFGGHDELTVLDNSIRERFGEVGIETTSFMYRNAKYNVIKKDTIIDNGEIINSDFLTDFPPLYSVIDSDGNIIGDEAVEEVQEETPPVESEEDELAALLGGARDNDSSGGSSSSGLANLDMNVDSDSFFSCKFTGSTYFIRNFQQNSITSGKESKITFRLDNPDIYDFSIDEASAYFYENSASLPSLNAESLSEEADTEESELTNTTVWSDDISRLNDMGISLKYEDNSVTINITKVLSDVVESNSTAAVMVSVPIKFRYINRTVSEEIMYISPEIQQMIEDCKVPDIIKNKADKFTKTYNFDSFFDKITSYRAIVQLENNTNLISSEQNLEETDFFIVDRLNIVIVSDISEK